MSNQLRANISGGGNPNPQAYQQRPSDEMPDTPDS